MTKTLPSSWSIIQNEDGKFQIRRFHRTQSRVFATYDEATAQVWYDDETDRLADQDDLIYSQKYCY